MAKTDNVFLKSSWQKQKVHNPMFEKVYTIHGQHSLIIYLEIKLDDGRLALFFCPDCTVLWSTFGDVLKK